MRRVDPDVINRATAAVNSMTRMKGILDALQEAEPDFLNWVQASTREELSRFSELPLHPGIIDTFQSTLMKSKVVAYYMHHLAYIDSWKMNSTMLPSEHEKALAIYELWTRGDLPEQYYPKKPKRGSIAYKAKQEFGKRKKERKALAKKIDEVSTKMNTMKQSDIDVDELMVSVEIPHLLETGVIDTPR